MPSPAHFNNLAVARQEVGDVDSAIDLLRQALRIDPGYLQARWNLSLALLLRGHTPGRALAGDLAQGWALFEARRELPGDRLARHGLAVPHWDGRSSLAWRRVLVRAEHGLGDTIQFLRFIPRLAVLGARRVVVECAPGLAHLVRGVEGVAGVVERGKAPCDVDVQVRMMSLGGVFRDRDPGDPQNPREPQDLRDPQDPAAKAASPLSGAPFPDTLRSDVLLSNFQLSNSSLSTSPPSNSLPYSARYLHADVCLAIWRDRLAGLAGFKVGVAWQGNPRFAGDARRSFPLSALAPLAGVPGVRLISLQKGRGSEQAHAPDAPPVDLLSPDLDKAGTFIDTAAVIRNLDLVITSDTAIAHLAGALGAPVWLALCAVPDWRWGLAGESTPWYPTMRLFRQKSPGDWAELFTRMAGELSRRVGAPPPVPQVMIPVAPGELVDRLTILRLKARRISEPAKRARVSAELAALREAAARSLPPSPALDALTADLSAANEALWEVEDALRACERDGRFAQEFVALARAVYHANDRRADLKRAVNDLLGASIADEKSYHPYVDAAASAV